MQTLSCFVFYLPNTHLGGIVSPHFPLRGEDIQPRCGEETLNKTKQNFLEIKECTKVLGTWGFI
jgi:hypothetical protein